MSITTDDKRKASLPLLIVTVQAIVVGALWLAQPYLRSHMEVDKAEIAKRIEEVEKRSKERKEKEDRERKKKKLKKEDVEKLKKEARKKNERKIRDRIKEMNEIRKEIKEEKRDVLEAVKEDEIADALEDLTNELHKDIKELQKKAETIDRDSQHEKAEKLHKETDELKKLADALKENPSEDVTNLQETAIKAGTVAKKLQDIQAEARNNPSERNKVGKEHKTKEYRQQLNDVSEKLNDLSTQAYKEDLDFSDIDEMIADDGMQLNADELLGMELDELYDVARQLEQEIATDFAAMRAAELSAIQDTEFKEMFEAVSKNPPERKDFDFEAMGEQLETLGDVGEFREELAEVSQEVQNMKQNAQNMQGQAMGFQRMGQQGQEGQQGKQAAQQQLAAQQAIGKAAQMQTGKSVMLDMSAQMRMSYNMSGGQSGDTLNPENKQSESILAAGKIKKKRIRVNTNKIKAEAMPGRKFTEASSRKGYLYVDTWYIIGPWKVAFTPQRHVDWKKIHPPEYEIDLAKTYKGKKGKELKWQFTQSNTLRTTPPDEQRDSTYYAYTEVHFEKAQDMLLAIASDDAAKVWVNDILVWQDNGLSAWSLDEGFRKVAFKKGFNKILIRIANGPVVCQYSLLLCPPDMK